MKKNIKGIYILEVLIFILVIIFNILKINYGLNAVLIAAAIYCYLRFGFVKDNSYEKGNVIRVVISSLLGYTIIMYALGIFTGFYRSSIKFTLEDIFLTIGLMVITIIAQELIRYIVAKNCTNNKKPLILLTIVFIILNIVTQINSSYFTDRWTIFVFISTFALPIVAREMICSYLAYKCSLAPNLIYRILMEVVFHLIPIIPNLGDYLYAVVRIMLPATIFFFSIKIFRYHEKSGTYTKKASRRIILVPIILFALVMIYLISGLFKYKMIAIGSGSMEPYFYRGDAVIYEKKTAKEVKEGDVLVFSHGHMIITHRIMSIVHDNAGRYNIVTKGDNNPKEDEYIVQTGDVIGIVKVPIKYVGYPTLWVNDLIK